MPEVKSLHAISLVLIANEKRRFRIRVNQIWNADRGFYHKDVGARCACLMLEKNASGAQRAPMISLGRNDLQSDRVEHHQRGQVFERIAGAECGRGSIVV